MVYVGQTKHPLKTRIAEHKATVPNQNMYYAIARHYTKENHGSAATSPVLGH